MEGIAPKISKDLPGIFATPLPNFTPIGEVSAEKTVTEQKREKTKKNSSLNLVSFPYFMCRDNNYRCTQNFTMDGVKIQQTLH